MQIALTIVILLAAAAYAGWRVWRSTRPGADPCDGCKLKKNCQKFGCFKEK